MQPLIFCVSLFRKNNFDKTFIIYSLDIPSQWILYPWFHPNRPDFFNIATLFSDVVESINSGLREYLEDVSQSTVIERQNIFIIYSTGM